MTTKRLVRIAFFTMLTIVGGLVRIPVPFTPISFTLQTFFVAVSGLILGGKDGAFAQLAYLALGLIGLPVFTAGGGFDYVLKPSFGYILSFPLQAFLTGFSVSKQKKLNVIKLFLCTFSGVLVNYAIGIAYQVMILIWYTHSTVAAAFATVPSVLLMLIKDFILVWLLCLLYPRMMKMIGRLDEQNKPVSNGMPSGIPREPQEDPDEKKEKKEKEGVEPPREPVPEPAGIISRS
ncbi:MAG: biotin transporter BioY [Clostridia bacterium]|nr:biotin transporter BioY [Clostridia bacterium]